MKNKLELFTVVVKLNKKHLVNLNKLFNYRVKILKQDQNQLQIKIYEKDLELLDKNGIEYKIVTYQGLKYFLNIFKKNVTVFIGMIIFTLLLYFNTMTIKEISFSTYTKDNQKIEEMIRSHIKTYYGNDVLESDINDLNLMLRKEFSQFEWISVDKKGSNLTVNILQPSIINKQVKHIEGFGDLIAKKNGIIKYFKVSHGVPLVDENIYVKQGDILVSGNLRAKDPNQGVYYVPAQGKVYAEIWDSRIIEVPKQEIDSQLTGRLFTEKGVHLLGFNWYYKKYDGRYEDCNIEEKTESLKIFNFSLPFQIKTNHYLEKDDIINTYNQKTAYDYAYSTIIRDINRHFDNEDQILEINLIKNSENEEKFVFEFFIKTYENIAFFQRR